MSNRVDDADHLDDLPTEMASYSQTETAVSGTAIERGSLIVVFNEHGHTLFSKARGNGPKDGLMGFTGSSVTVRFGSVIYSYDERGQTVYAKAA